MANFSVSQVRQMYVVSGYADGTTIPAVDESSAIGTIEAKCINDGLQKELYFLYKGADTVLKSDFINLKNLDYIKAIDAADMVIPMKKLKVSLDPAVNGGNPVSGQDYILRIEFKNFFSDGDDSQYFKDVAVHATSGMSATAFYAALKDALDKCFAREVNATSTSNPYLKFTSDANGLYIEEKPQEWQLGTMKQRRIMFNAVPTTIYYNGDDLIWGKVEDQTPAKSAAVVGTNAIGNGHKTADLEWFCMGERGDQYRMVGWPIVIPTKYLVDPDKEYHMLEIHYAFTDTGVNSYRTEKDMTIAVPKGAAGEEYDVINALIGAINTATGLNVSTL